jgi:hypothetical protein
MVRTLSTHVVLAYLLTEVNLVFMRLELAAGSMGMSRGGGLVSATGGGWQVRLNCVQ